MAAMEVYPGRQDVAPTDIHSCTEITPASPVLPEKGPTLQQLRARAAVLGGIRAEGVAFLAVGVGGLMTGVAETASVIILIEGGIIKSLDWLLRTDENDPNRLCYDFPGLDERVDNAILRKINKIPTERGRRATTWVARHYAGVGIARALREESPQQDQMS